MKITPLKAIKKHCLECSGYEKKQVRECVGSDCVLFPYRLGSNPNRQGCTMKKNTASKACFEKADVMCLLDEFVRKMNVEDQEILRKKHLKIYLQASLELKTPFNLDGI